MMMAVIRGGYLWTRHHAELSGTNGAYSGNQTGAFTPAFAENNLCNLVAGNFPVLNPTRQSLVKV